jgi:hypothetical protein
MSQDANITITSDQPDPVAPNHSAFSTLPVFVQRVALAAQIVIIIGANGQQVSRFLWHRVHTALLHLTADQSLRPDVAASLLQLKESLSRLEASVAPEGTTLTLACSSLTDSFGAWIRPVADEDILLDYASEVAVPKNRHSDGCDTELDTRAETSILNALTSFLASPVVSYWPISLSPATWPTHLGRINSMIAHHGVYPAAWSPLYHGFLERNSNQTTRLPSVVWDMGERTISKHLGKSHVWGQLKWQPLGNGRWVQRLRSPGYK